MHTRALLSLSLSALVLGGSAVGCTANRGGIASVGERVGAATAKLAAANAAKAEKALARRDAAAAIGFAEAAVTSAPRSSAYRALLGQAYLQAGRFASARTAFADALELSPEDSRAALNLSLAETATGDWAASRATLTRYASVIPVEDRGLALALAGDPAGAVQLLTAAARAPGATATTRQNLALALALGGQWPMAKAVAAADLSPADVDARMADWASFAQPQAASDQVAALLGVQSAIDPGQPVALALNAVAPVAVVDAAPRAPEPLEAAPVEVAGVQPEPAPAAAFAEPAPAVPAGAIRFAERREVVQPLPVATLRPDVRSAKLALSPRASAPAEPGKGDWYVQLGAFDSSAVARDAWGRAQRRLPALRAHQPAGMNFALGDDRFYRLSVGGFARADAVQLCARYRAAGGQCFVRADAGDRIAAWLRPGVQLAAR